MDVKAEISWIQAELIKLKDPKIIQAVKELLQSKSDSVKQTNDFDEALDRAFSDVQQNRTTPHSIVREKYKKWL